MIYEEFLHSKALTTIDCGVTPRAVHKMLFDFQRDIVRWALRKGRSAIFADCGLGKTLMQLEWARQIPGKVLILVPLAVSEQTVREGTKIGVKVEYARKPCNSRITITNYQMLDRFDPSMYTGLVLDESSIIKHFEGKIRNQIIGAFRKTPYRLACTATPAPNDYMELGNHSEFLGLLTRTEMLSTFFVHDGGDTSKWRLKRHAEKDFWQWVCSWAVMLRMPSDLGYKNGRFKLPPLMMHEHVVTVEGKEAASLMERRQARAASVDVRCDAAYTRIRTKAKEQWLIWCNLNSESEGLAEIDSKAIELTGSDSHEMKEKLMLMFSNRELRYLITKPSIAGFGMNWQNCANVIFLGLSDSYEQFYQAIRRCWRFGQKNTVHCWIITSSREGAVLENIKRKEADADRMAREMVSNMHELNKKDLHATARKSEPYIRRVENGTNWTMHLADCVDVMEKIPEESMDYSIFSPPFASLYTYSASERDMGNSRTHAEFYEHMKYMLTLLYKVLRSGRLVSFHCMNLPTSKERDGVIGITDFRGKLISLFSDAGFVYHSEVTIWKNPVTAMQRTKALGLLHKQLKKDSCMSRQGIPDYLVTMRKGGVNDKRVTHTNKSFPVSVWQNYASPVWLDINPSNTLQRTSARADKDERHICPLQLEVIARALRLWTNKGDWVFSPFAGIGSEGYEALRSERKFLGIELKESYWKQAVANLQAADKGTALQTLPKNSKGGLTDKTLEMCILEKET